MKIISFVGRHNSGKTTVLTKIVPLLKNEGIRLAIIKHSGKEINELPSNADSDILFNSGSDIVYLISPKMSLYYSRDEQEKSLEEVIKTLPEDIDLIIIEGYKKEHFPKIEIIREDIDPLPLSGITNVIARVTDCKFDNQLPVFGLDEEYLIFKFILNWFSNKN